MIRDFQFKKVFPYVFQQILPQNQLIYQAFFVWPQSGAESQRLWNQLYYIKVAQIKKSSRICYTSFKSFSNKSARIFGFEQLLFNKVDFRASDFEVALQLQIEAKRKMLGWSVAFGVKSVEKHLIRRNFF